MVILMKKRVVIIGGGASGIMCSLHLSKLSKKFEILILEKQNRIGKKLLVTGNGKCNLTNQNVSFRNYNHPQFLKPLIEQFSFNDCLEYFKKLGLFIRTDDVGRGYPYSESAKAFLDFLLAHLEKEQVKIKTSEEVVDVKKINNQYIVKSSNNEYKADAVVFASGGQASINFENNTYKILQKLNHQVTKLRPGLVPISVKEDLKHLHGVRVKAKASLLYNNKTIVTKDGEIQFRKDGLSGIVCFELSSIYNRLNLIKDVMISLDLMQDYTRQEIKDLLLSKYQEGFNNEDVLIGLFNKMIAWELYRRCERKKKYVDSIVQEIKDFRFTVTGTHPLQNAQVTIGGINIDEINPNFESVINPNLYIIGELLDIDGDTGGYNLHFAWLSGVISANNIYRNFNK